MRLRSLLFAGALAICAACGLRAQTPGLRPIRTYLEAADSGDVSALRYVARRCTALFALIKNHLEQRGDSATAARYEAAGVAFLTLADSAERAMGSSKSDAAVSTQRGIEAIAHLLVSRMNANMAATGSYYAEDDLLRSDVRTCTDLTTRAR